MTKVERIKQFCKKEFGFTVTNYYSEEDGYIHIIPNGRNLFELGQVMRLEKEFGGMWDVIGTDYFTYQFRE